MRLLHYCGAEDPKLITAATEPFKGYQTWDLKSGIWAHQFPLNFINNAKLKGGGGVGKLGLTVKLGGCEVVSKPQCFWVEDFKQTHEEEVPANILEFMKLMAHAATGDDSKCFRRFEIIRSAFLTLHAPRACPDGAGEQHPALQCKSRWI